MLHERPTIYLIGGCNGAGKTTFAREFLPKEVDCLRFMNADEIARGLSPFAPEVAGIRAGRVLLSEVDEAIRLGNTFGWESTLAGHAQEASVKKARRAGFEIEIHYLFVPSVEICLQRIRQRVREGGHDVPLGMSSGGSSAVLPISSAGTLRSPTDGRCGTRAVHSLAPSSTLPPRPSRTRAVYWARDEGDQAAPADQAV